MDNTNIKYIKYNKFMRNIVALDLESTGLNIKTDQIIQISMIKIDNNYNIVDRYMTYVQPVAPYTITLSAYLKHKIIPKMLADKPFFKDIAPKILDFVKGCDLLGYNLIKFDLPLLYNEFKKIGIVWDFSNYHVYDSYLEEIRRNGNSLEMTYERYYGKKFEESGLTAHNAESDVLATIEIYKKQNSNEPMKYERILSADGFLKYDTFGSDAEEICFAKGKYANVSVRYVKKYDPKYIDWVLNNNELDSKTKDICRKI